MAAAKDGNGGRIWEISFRILTAGAGLCLPVIVGLLVGIYGRIGALEVGQAEIKVELRLADDKSDEIDNLTRALHVLQLEVERLKREQS